MEALLLVLLGVVLGSGADRLAIWFRRAWTGKRIAISLRDELASVNFYPGDAPNFAPFTSQVFDNHLRDVASSLPVTLSRDIMQYYRLMKYMELNEDP